MRRPIRIDLDGETVIEGRKITTESGNFKSVTLLPTRPSRVTREELGGNRARLTLGTISSPAQVSVLGTVQQIDQLWEAIT